MQPPKLNDKDKLNAIKDLYDCINNNSNSNQLHDYVIDYFFLVGAILSNSFQHTMQTSNPLFLLLWKRFRSNHPIIRHIGIMVNDYAYLDIKREPY